MLYELCGQENGLRENKQLAWDQNSYTVMHREKLSYVCLKCLGSFYCFSGPQAPKNTNGKIM